MIEFNPAQIRQPVDLLLPHVSGHLPVSLSSGFTKSRAQEKIPTGMRQCVDCTCQLRKTPHWRLTACSELIPSEHWGFYTERHTNLESRGLRTILEKPGLF